ncbi:MAG: ATP phosphoribosyltransferase [Chloroflexi bacterium]|nr:ATP phosphoribosyltransferase [Chloroflexota bacterium]MBM3174105.1 ATP phosphoribosyltransferase [Chloroflexota bacterium]MBM4449827.1 ATP phosphoribosyltransferase [Chloroflexota bacterium]
MLTERQSEYIKLALPKGKLLPATACLLNEIGLKFDNYTQETRVYRLQSTRYSNISGKIFQEKDIPIQVAVGNYDFGICGLDWIEELLNKYPASPLVKLADLGYGRGNVYLATSLYGGPTQDELANKQICWRIVSEYPNLAENLALSLRLRRFNILPLWGAAEAYPPENAELAVLWAKNEAALKDKDLAVLRALLPANAHLIANKENWQGKNVSQVMSYFSRGLEASNKPWQRVKTRLPKSFSSYRPNPNGDKIWLAVPDGHQQEPALEFLTKAGLDLPGYSAEVLNRRPSINLDWVNVKVIRPQDMPLQVANGNFDLAITGKDWLLNHLYRFPTSPATELMELGFGKVRIVAVVTQELPAADINDLRKMVQSGKLSPLRVATEYIDIADKYLHDNHISKYKIIPTWGASEALLPEDADLLIENTQTGKTLAKHKLKIIDNLFQSTACLIGNRDSMKSVHKSEKINFMVDLFRRTVANN